MKWIKNFSIADFLLVVVVAALTVVLLLMFGGCVEAEKTKRVIDVEARQEIIKNFEYIYQNRQFILENRQMIEGLRDRGRTLLWPRPKDPLPKPIERMKCVRIVNMAPDTPSYRGKQPEPKGVVNDKYELELRFDEQHVTGGCAQVTLTERQAIDFVNTMYPEMDAFAALDFFISNHFAWYVDDEGKKTG